MSEAYTLDANTLIAFFRDEEGAGAIEVLLDRASKDEITLYMSAVNLTEIIYAFEREKNADELVQLWDEIRALPITIERELTDDFIAEAAHIKTTYGIPLGDIFGLATARIMKSKFVTGDHTDFDHVEEAERGSIYFFR